MIRLLSGIIGLCVLVSGLPAEAAEPLEILNEQAGALTPTLIQLILLITILAVVPGLVAMATSFTKFVVVFSVLRSALGTQQSPPNVVIIGLALFLTLFVMQPTMEKAWEEGLSPYLSGQAEPVEAMDRTLAPFRTFMMAQVRAKDLVLFEELAASRVGAPPAAAGAAQTAGEPAFTTLVPAFMTSELRKAFTIAFLLFVPFLVIEMIVSSILMAMGMMMLPPVIISLPFKLIFFVLVDGWWLLSGSLVRSYG